MMRTKWFEFAKLLLAVVAIIAMTGVGLFASGRGRSCEPEYRDH